MDYYLLGPDGETPEPFDMGGPEFSARSMDRLAKWYMAWERQRAIREDPFPCGGRVSTIFLGFNHNLWTEGPPLLFETMAFDATGEPQFQHRETTKRRALKTHAQVLAHVMAKAG